MTLDLLALIPIGVAVALLVAVVVTVPEGAYERYLSGRRYHRSGRARHARTTAADPVATIPDALPFAARTA